MSVERRSSTTVRGSIYTKTDIVMDTTERIVESLLSETDELLEKVKAAEELRKKELPSLFTLQPRRLRNWRIQRQGSAITSTYESLFPRLTKAVENSSSLMLDINEKTGALGDQAKTLKVRLCSCIGYNAEYLSTKGNMVDELRQIVDTLSAYSSDIKAMITFNVEVIRQKLVQSVSQGRSFVSWGNRAMLMRPISGSLFFLISVTYHIELILL